MCGVNRSFPDGIRDALELIGTAEGVTRAAALHLMIVRDRTLFFADTSLNIDPTAEQLAHIAVAAADVAQGFGHEPRVAMLSFGNFGTVDHPSTRKVQAAVEIARGLRPAPRARSSASAPTTPQPCCRRHRRRTRMTSAAGRRGSCGRGWAPWRS